MNRASIVCTSSGRAAQAAQETFSPNLASRQVKTKLYFSPRAGKHNLNFRRFHITHYAIVCERIFKLRFAIDLQCLKIL